MEVMAVQNIDIIFAHLLFIAGDDECVCVWNMDDFKCEQVLHSNQWGQVTVLCWVFVEPPLGEKSTSICIGTGRGFVSLCLISKQTSISSVLAYCCQATDQLDFSGFPGRM